MAVYTCPECKAKVNLEKAVKPGQLLSCPECDFGFKPRAETVAFKDEIPVAKSKKSIAKAALAKPAAAVETAVDAPQRKLADDDEGPMTYGLAVESEEEARLAQKNKPSFGNLKDKFTKSARGPAAALLVMPSNLMLAQGGLLAIFGLSAIILGIWPLWFTDVPASDEEFAECTFWIFFGIVSVCWGSITCFGAVQMVTLGSYGWGVVGAVFGLFPLLAGIFALTTLRDPRVLAGFAEPETGPIQSEKTDTEMSDEYDEEEEATDDDEEDEEDEDDRPARRKR